MENDLTIIPVLNKIDLPAAQPEKYAEELANLIGCEPEDCLLVSGKTGEGVEEVLDRIITDIPAPVGDADAPARAMIFDSVYDTYRGVVTYVRVIDGSLSPREKIEMMSTGTLMSCWRSAPPCRTQGDEGWASARSATSSPVSGCATVEGRDTVTAAQTGRSALGGYREPKPMVFSGLFPIDGSSYPVLRDALDKLKLNDASLA